MRPGPSRTRLVSTYYDSAERTLARRCLTLRVRKAGRRYIQTVKSAGAAGGSMLGRGEWEDVVASERPDLGARETGRLLPPEIGKHLQPVFSTRVVRLVIPLAPTPDTRIEAAVDRGDIRAVECSRAEPINEIELELREGSPTALYDVALKLLEIAPVRLDLRSKAERGYSLAADGAPADQARPGRAEIGPEETGEAALHAVGHACVTQLLANEEAALTGDAEGIHQMRVALRRLRAILSAFGKLIPKERRSTLDGELHWLTRALGAARNLDVFAGVVAGPATQAVPDAAALERLGKAVERHRRAAYGSARQAIRSPRYTALLLTLMRWFDGRLWRGGPGQRTDERLFWPVRELAPLLLDRRRRQVKKRSRGFARQSPEQRHCLRIALKKLRYTLELFAALYDPEETRRTIQWLKRLQDWLGEANDLQTGRKLVDELARGRRGPVAQAGHQLLLWHARRLEAIEPRLRDHLRQLRRAPRLWRATEQATAETAG